MPILMLAYLVMKAIGKIIVSQMTSHEIKKYLETTKKNNGKY